MNVNESLINLQNLQDNVDTMCKRAESIQNKLTSIQNSLNIKDEYYSNKLKELELKYNGDVEAIHSEADKILLDILKYTGFNEVVKEFNKLKKYYA